MSTNGALILNQVVNEKNFADRAYGQRKRSDELSFWYGHAMFCIGFACSYSGLDLPKLNRKENKCVHEHLQICLPPNLSGNKIDRIRDVGHPHDDPVANRYPCWS